MSGAGLFERVLKEQKEEAPEEEGDPSDDDGPPDLIPPSPHSYWSSVSTLLSAPSTTGPSVTAQLPVAPATMSNPSMSKISSLCPDMLIFFQIASLGHRDTDAVPLACQEKGYYNIVHFGLLSDAEWKIGFQDYDTNGDGTGYRLPISLGVQNEIGPAIAYCRFHLSNSNDPDRTRPQCWSKDEYNKFYFQFRLGAITNSPIASTTGKITLTNIMSTSSLTPAQELQNFMRAHTDSLMILKKKKK